MRRTIVLGIIVLGGVITTAMLGAQQGAAPAGQGREAGPGRGAGGAGAPVQAIEKVKDNLYLIQGQGGNTAVYVAQNGVVIVDTKNPNNGQAILDQIKTVTDKPITHIINTHTHGDHTGSNQFFPASVEVIVQENTKGYMEKMPVFQEEANKNGLPDRTFKDKMSVLKGKDQIDLYYFGPAHTGGDAFIVFKNARVDAHWRRVRQQGISRSSIATTAAAASRIPTPSRRRRRASRTWTRSSTATRR